MISHSKVKKLTYKKMSRKFTASYSLLRTGETFSYIPGIGNPPVQQVNHWRDAED